VAPRAALGCTCLSDCKAAGQILTHCCHCAAVYQVKYICAGGQCCLWPCFCCRCYLRYRTRMSMLVSCAQVVGALHHGKTTLMDMLVEQTHDVASLGIRTKGGKPLRFTDTRLDEQVRLPCTSPLNIHALLHNQVRSHAFMCMYMGTHAPALHRHPHPPAHPTHTPTTHSQATCPVPPPLGAVSPPPQTGARHLH
jgi:hypothetical protein